MMVATLILWLTFGWYCEMPGYGHAITPLGTHTVTTQPLHPVIVRAHVVRRNLGRR